MADRELHELKLPAALRQYQWDGVSFLVHASSALLADEMGLGKTVQAAIALRLALKDPCAGRVLVVAPASLVLNWTSELDKWAPELVVRRVVGDARNREALYNLPIQVLVASYEQIRVDGLGAASNVDFDILVLDEAQRIKNSEATTSLACRLLHRKRAWALTGTPLENSPRDLTSVFRLVCPGLLRPGATRADIHNRVRPHLLRRRKTEVLGELPPVITQDIPIELSEAQRAAYDRKWAERFESLAQMGGPATGNLLALFTALKQLCNFDPDSGESAKLEYCQAVCEEAIANGQKVLLFSQFVGTLRWLSERLGISHRMLCGDMEVEARSSAVAWFNGASESCALLISLRAGGVGLNLQGAEQVILFDRWWNPAVEAQAVARAHRFGRTAHLHVHRLRVSDSVEERIAAVLARKEALFEEYVNSAQSVVPAKLTRSELLRILGLPPGGAPEDVIEPVTGEEDEGEDR